MAFLVGCLPDMRYMSTKVEMAIDQHTKQLGICFCFNSVCLGNIVSVFFSEMFSTLVFDALSIIIFSVDHS